MLIAEHAHAEKRAVADQLSQRSTANLLRSLSRSGRVSEHAKTLARSTIVPRGLLVAGSALVLVGMAHLATALPSAEHTRTTVDHHRPTSATAADRYAVILSQKMSSFRPASLKGMPSLSVAVPRTVANTLPSGNLSSQAVHRINP